MSWERVVSLQELEHKKSALLKKGSKQIAVFKMGSDVLAVDKDQKNTPLNSNHHYK